MITYTDLGKHGRLGNSMFQYAFVKALSIRHGRHLVLPNYNAELYRLFQIPDPKERINRVTERLFERDMPYSGVFDKAIRESAHTAAVDFYGYFQDERYFADCSETIRQIFTFGEPVRSKAKEIISGIPHPVCALHVRRTDYFDTAGTLPVQGLEYYKKAISHYPKHVFLVVSDDIEWCKKTLVGNRFVFPEERSTELDMCLISESAGAIIANSSFSWWGAWLGNTDKVVAPINWFGPNTPYSKWPMAPSRWLRE